MRKIKIREEHFMEIYRLLDEDIGDILKNHSNSSSGDHGWPLSSDEDIRDQVRNMQENDNISYLDKVTQILSRIFTV